MKKLSNKMQKRIRKAKKMLNSNSNFLQKIHYRKYGTVKNV